MTSAAPTILTLETDSAWAVILVVSLVTLPLVLLLRRLIGRPGGVSSGILLGLPLLLPIVAGVAFQSALLPEFAVLRPAREVLTGSSHDLLHLMYFLNGGTVTPYVTWGSAGPWILMFAIGASSLMLLRRAIGTFLIHRLIRRCEAPTGAVRSTVNEKVLSLCGTAGLDRIPKVLLLPAGMEGAFAVGAFRARILISRSLIEDSDPDELEAILAHEIAHIEARDIHLVSFAGFLRDLVVWNPIAHLAFRKLRQDREYEADRRAAAMTGNPLAVASGLLRMCELRKARGVGRRAALAFLRPGGKVARRIQRLLDVADGRVAVRREASVAYVAAACMVAIVGLQAGAHIARDTSALAISWGAVDQGGVYAPRAEIKQDPKGGGKQKAPQATSRAELESPQRKLTALKASSVKLSDVDAWIKEMGRLAKKAKVPGAKGLSPVTVAWEARQDWEVVPIRCPVGSICIHRLDRQGH